MMLAFDPEPTFRYLAELLTSRSKLGNVARALGKWLGSLVLASSRRGP
jgi:hypothetical protein